MASPVRTALFSALRSDTALTRLLAAPTRRFPAAVYHEAAPLNAPMPYVIFAAQDPGRPTWTFDGPPAESAIWLVKAVCEGASATPAEDAAREIDRVLNDAQLTIADTTLLYIRLASRIGYREQNGPDLWRHVGGVYRLVTEPT